MWPVGQTLPRPVLIGKDAKNVVLYTRVHFQYSKSVIQQCDVQTVSFFKIYFRNINLEKLPDL